MDFQEPYFGLRWLWYQALRFAVLWAAVWVLWESSGLWVMLVSACLFGMTMRADYWSNCVELLAASLCCAAPYLGLDWRSLVPLGFVLGFGRETLPLLALLGTAPAFSFAAMAAVSQAVLWGIGRTPGHYAEHEKLMEHGKSQAWRNLALIFGKTDWESRICAGIWAALVVLAAFQVPWLALGLGAATFWKSKIDEPRVVTMLVPFAARTLCGA